MMSLALIEQLSRKAGERACLENREPFVAFTDKDDAVFKCPNLGDYVPDGWKLIDQLFVDKVGSGADDEPALTGEQFIEKVKSGMAWSLQGHYGRTAKSMIDIGFLDETGKINYDYVTDLLMENEI